MHSPNMQKASSKRGFPGLVAGQDWVLRTVLAPLPMLRIGAPATEPISWCHMTISICLKPKTPPSQVQILTVKQNAGPQGSGVFVFGSGGAFVGKRTFICKAISVGRLATGDIRSKRPQVLLN